MEGKCIDCGKHTDSTVWVDGSFNVPTVGFLCPPCAASRRLATAMPQLETVSDPAAHKPIYRIEEWQFVNSFGRRIYGKIFGHPNITNGAFSYTSRLVDVDECLGKAETEHSIYVLGVPGNEQDPLAVVALS